MEALYLIPTCLTVFLLIREQRRHDEEKRAWRLERVGLLTRIQAPELAATLAAPEPSDEPLYVPFDDDAAHDEWVKAQEIA